MDAQTQQIIAQLQQQLAGVQQQLQQSEQTQQHQRQQLQAMYAQLQAQPVPSSPPAASAPALHGTKPLVKPRPPSTFSAATDKVGELDQWEREMRYQFAAFGPALASEEARIAFAVSYLGAVPLQWWDANPTHRAVRSWEEFVALLRARFRPVHAAKQARAELFRIRQAAGQSAGEYAAAFQQLLVSLPDMHVDDQVFLFVRGLQPLLKRRVGDKEYATLGAAINAAVQSEGLYGLQVVEDSSESVRSASSAAGSAMDLNALLEDNEERGSVNSRALASLASQVGQIQEQLCALQGGHRARREDRVPGLSKQQMDDRRAAGQCFRCGKHGHFKSDCPQANRC
jgi:hypothetical protein